MDSSTSLGDPLLRRLDELAGEMLVAHTDENGAGVTDEMRLFGSVLLCDMREKHLALFLESKLKADAVLTLQMRDASLLEDSLSAELEMQRFLSARIASLLDFKFSDAAKKLLQLDEQEAQAAALDQGNMAALKAERENRMELLRELERLIERRRDLQSELAVIRGLLEAVPTRLNEFAARVAQMQDAFGSLGPSRALTVADAASLPLPLRTVYLHLAAFVEANLIGLASVTLRKKGTAAIVELDLGKKKAGSNYCLLFGGGEDRVYVEVLRGPNATAWSNCLSLVNLFPGDEGAQCTPLGRNYAWIDDVATRGNIQTVTQMFQLLEKRFVSQRYLSPQLDLLCQLQVHQQISLNGTRISPISKLLSFVEQAQSSSLVRLFVARIECPGTANTSLIVHVRVSPEYPRVRPTFRFELSATSRQETSWPDWVMKQARFKVPPPSQIADATLAGLEYSVNTARGPRDANFDLSTRIAKTLLAFDLYCYAVLDNEAAKATWNLSRASCIGRERQIQCECF